MVDEIGVKVGEWLGEEGKGWRVEKINDDGTVMLGGPGYCEACMFARLDELCRGPAGELIRKAGAK